MKRSLAIVVAALAVGASFSEAAAAPARSGGSRSTARKASAPAPAPPPAPSASERAWKEAMQLSDQQLFDDALALLDSALKEDPTNVDLRWLEAEVLGWAGRHVASVAHFESLVEDQPETADGVRIELGNQRLWSGDARGALREAETALALNPDDREAQQLRALALAHSGRYDEALEAFAALRAKHPEDVDLAVDEATVMGWAGRNAAAAAAFAKILEEHPAEARARVGLAENENWQGNHRRAAKMFRNLIAGGHQEPEVYKGLAFASYWDDDPVTASAALDRYTMAQPEDREAKDLARALRFEQDQSVTAGIAGSSDSDDLDIRTLTVDYRLPLATQTTLLALVRDDHVEDAGGVENPLRIGVGVERRWDERFKASAFAFYFDPRSAASSTALGHAELTYRPGDRTRYDFGVEIEPVLTRLALANEIRSTNVAAAMTGRVAEHVTLAGGAVYRDYNDGNSAVRLSADLRWDLPSPRPIRWAALFGAEHLAAAEDLNDGYYDPLGYYEVGPGVEVAYEFANQATLAGELRGGVQREHGASREFYYSAAAVGRVPLGRSLRLVLELGTSNSSLSSASGFQQTRASAYLNVVF